ncbi:MAG: hypothetical protein M3198_07960 [Actinomycetota bacterium]|nr:hypothetical protein [Actinomycetota bacterium]
MRFKVISVSLALAVLGAMSGAIPVSADHESKSDIHSKKIDKRGRDAISINKNTFAQGSDLAFQRRLLVAGAYEGTGFFRLKGKDRVAKQISFYNCPGSQGDVSILGDYVFISVDSPSSNSGKSGVCNNTPTRGFGESEKSSEGAEGIRVIDISNIRQPRQVAFVETECGSHTHTLVPRGRKTFVYVQSYPIQQSLTCNAAEHRSISVLEFPTRNPKKIQLVSQPEVVRNDLDSIGCHDATVYPKKDLAVFACLGVFLTVDISNTKNPEVLATVRNPAIELDHSAAITWDGKVAIIGDEHAGAAGGGGCSEDSRSPVGAMWFYDISDPKNPVEKGYHSLPRVPPADSTEEAEALRCTTHNFNILPMKNKKRYIVVSAYYQGGFAAVNFSDPSNPREIAHYLPVVKGQNPDMWSTYWYNGRIYSNEHASKLGVSTFKMRGFGYRKVHFFKGRLNPQVQIPRFKRR